MDKRLIYAIRAYYCLGSNFSDKEIAENLARSFGADACRLSLALKDFGWAVYDAMPEVVRRIIDSEQERLVSRFGEQHRKMIRQAILFLDNRETKWRTGAPIDREKYIGDLVHAQKDITEIIKRKM